MIRNPKPNPGKGPRRRAGRDFSRYGRSLQEGVFGETKSHCQLDYIPVRSWLGRGHLKPLAATRRMRINVGSWFALCPSGRPNAFAETVYFCLSMRRVVMSFSVGILELGMVGVLLLTAAILAAFRLAAWRWAMIGVACAIVAVILSPADPLSTILLGAVLLIFFVSGIRFGGRRPIAAA
jgi:hypothetical protein